MVTRYCKYQSFCRRFGPRENQIQLSEKRLATIQTPSTYISQRGGYEKCFSFDAPFIKNENLKFLQLSISPKIFGGNYIGNGLMLLNKTLFSVSFHYPNQKLKSFAVLQKEWESKYETSLHYFRKYHVALVEVLRRRYRTRLPCIDRQYDNTIIQHAMETIGCKHSGIKLGSETPICKTRKEFMEFQYELYEKEHSPPCESVQSMYQWIEEADWTIKCNNTAKQFCKNGRLTVQINFSDDLYKEIIYLKAYTIESLIGNTGGYIGKCNTT